ncbi:E3 ubiquitin-protein ligase TRIM11-like [Rana temporaria]|uniref:E3 ubiquitin-protein ligase TRIM11-like n=1 Tax=Rana temporaria TaxID=8407 RepID=UPI001AADB29D|nr:E3 ubiquitin-protein ligase TRIM11-like [Rana temporaria]
MASAEIIEEPRCCICTSNCPNPMTLNCGHGFCWECITIFRDKQVTNEGYSCPKCRKRDANQPRIFCTQCLHTSKLAVKSCLLCEAHLCEDHLRIHNTSPEHVLLKPTNDLKSRKCPNHNRILEYYCNEDDVFLCGSCRDGGHQGHQVEKLEEVFMKTERKLSHLHEQKKKVEENKGDITGKVDRLFRDMRQRLEDLEERVRREVCRQAEQSSASNLIQELKAKKARLSCKMVQPEELCNTTNQRDGGLHGSTKVTDVQNETCEQDEFLISMILHAGLSDIVKMKDDRFPVLKPTGITLDINTAAKDVQISDDLKTAVSTTDVIEKRPRPRGRFQTCRVLSTNTFSSGRHYWVVETSTSGNWAVGMCYPSISKVQGWIGETNKSWGLKKLYGLYHIQHNRTSQHLSDMAPCNSFAVCLDYEAGRLSFYALCDPVRLLHTFTTTFTEPLNAVLQVGEEGSHSQIKVL